MPLTPEDVRSKRFTPVRLREGYDMGEVDQFLDEVEAELERLTQENSDLRSEVAGSDSATATQVAPEPTRPVESAPAADDATPSQPQAAQQEPITTISQASGAAARLLELATRNADEVVADAKDQADTILAEARTKAERMDTEARTKADRMESDARARAQQLDSETGERRQQLLGDLEKNRDSLAREVEHLRSFEREYRSRLKNYFSSQLAQLEGDESVGASLPGSEAEQPPNRLRSLLGGDDGQQQAQPDH
jgi:DivIVA domain-containing protein